MQHLKNIKKWLPLLFLLLIILLFYFFNLQKYFSFSFLQQENQRLKIMVADHFFLSLLIFGGIYIIVAATSLPIAAFLTILGGFLFGPFVSLIVIDISATIGATLLFLVVKTTFGELLKEKATPWVKKMEEGFQQNASSYLLSLRLVPLFPFWAVTVVSALLGMNVRSFFLATLIGIIPGTFVYALVGNGLGALLEKGQPPDLHIIFSPEIFFPLLGLALLSLLPILYKKRKNNNGNKKS
jgi:LPXTG-motif cell wall-anchored protein